MEPTPSEAVAVDGVAAAAAGPDPAVAAAGFARTTTFAGGRSSPER